MQGRNFYRGRAGRIGYSQRGAIRGAPRRTENRFGKCCKLFHCSNLSSGSCLLEVRQGEIFVKVTPDYIVSENPEGTQVIVDALNM